MEAKQAQVSRTDTARPARASAERADPGPRKAPYVPPALVRHGVVQRVTLGGGSFIP